MSDHGFADDKFRSRRMSERERGGGERERMNLRGEGDSRIIDRSAGGSPLPV